jgi:hypothetical protein
VQVHNWHPSSTHTFFFCIGTQVTQ